MCLIDFMFLWVLPFFALLLAYNIIFESETHITSRVNNNAWRARVCINNMLQPGRGNIRIILCILLSIILRRRRIHIYLYILSYLMYV